MSDKHRLCHMHSLDLSVGVDAYINILTYLEVEDIARSVAPLSKKHRAISISNLLWKLLYKRDAKRAVWKGYQTGSDSSWHNAYKTSRERGKSSVICELDEEALRIGFSFGICALL